MFRPNWRWTCACIIVSVDVVERVHRKQRMLLFLHIFSYGWMINSIFRWNNSKTYIHTTKKWIIICALSVYEPELWLHADIYTEKKAECTHLDNSEMIRFPWLPFISLCLNAFVFCCCIFRLSFRSFFMGYFLYAVVCRCENSGAQHFVCHVSLILNHLSGVLPSIIIKIDKNELNELYACRHTVSNERQKEHGSKVIQH